MSPASGIDPRPILSRLEALGIRLGLERVRTLLAALGDPQRRIPAVLVAGTNGKGSTSALVDAMTRAAGYRTGLYTSPHLETVEERLRLDGRAIPSGRLGELLAELVAVAEAETGSPPTYFEALTVAAFRWFAAEAVDLAVVEVGMGGRLDATNLAAPLLSVITPIAFDHREMLGDTLAAIAREKAGILRPGRPALAWIEDEEPAEAVRAAAAGLGTPLQFASDEVRIDRIEPLGWEGQRVRLSTPVRGYDLRLALLGDHQARNLGLAVRVAEVLSELGFERLDARAVAAGAAACRWPGRLEVVDLPDGRRALLDAAHNEAGAAVLAAFLARIGEPVDLLFGALADKDVQGMLADLAPHARHVVLTTPPSLRARPPEELAALLPDHTGVLVEPDPGRALDRALGLGGETLVACGSIFLTGEVRKGLRERFGVPGAV